MVNQRPRQEYTVPEVTQQLSGPEAEGQELFNRSQQMVACSTPRSGVSQGRPGQPRGSPRPESQRRSPGNRLTPCSMLSLARSVTLEMRVSAPVEGSREDSRPSVEEGQSRSHHPRLSSVLSALPPTPQDHCHCRGLSVDGTKFSHSWIRLQAQPLLCCYCLSVLDSDLTILYLSSLGCKLNMLK